MKLTKFADLAAHDAKYRDIVKPILDLIDRHQYFEAMAAMSAFQNTDAPKELLNKISVLVARAISVEDRDRPT